MYLEVKDLYNIEYKHKKYRNILLYYATIFPVILPLTLDK